MPSDAATKAAKEIYDITLARSRRFSREINEWLGVQEIAGIIDKNMEPPPPTAEEMREHEELYQIRAPRFGDPTI